LVPCCGGLEHTKLCVPALLRHSRAPFELLFVDVGSLDGTAEYLAGIAAAAPVHVEVIRAATDLDIGKACAEALRRARREFREQHKGKWQEAERLGGFCLLLKREVLGRVGPLDEEGLGLFDTDLLSQKARQAGYTLAVCRDLFVHHFGTRTFAQGAPAEPA